MKLISLASAIFASLLFSVVTKADDVVEQSYTIKDVLEVHASSGIKLELTQGDTESLNLKAPAKVFKQIHVDQTDHKLSLKIDTNIFHLSGKEQIVFTLKVKNLQLLDLSGGVEANIGKLTLDKLIIKSSGGSEAEFANLQVKDLNIDTSGGAEVNLGTIKSEKVNLVLSGGSELDVKSSGSTNSLTINTGGGSECKAEKLSSETAEVVAGGASEIQVRASKTLKVTAGGASSVDYYGKPTVNSNVGGASDLSAKN